MQANVSLLSIRAKQYFWGVCHCMSNAPRLRLFGPSVGEARAMRQMFSFCRLDGGFRLWARLRSRCRLFSIFLFMFPFSFLYFCFFFFFYLFSFFFFRVVVQTLLFRSFPPFSFRRAFCYVSSEQTITMAIAGVISNTCQQVRPFCRFLNAFVRFCVPLQIGIRLSFLFLSLLVRSALRNRRSFIFHMVDSIQMRFFPGAFFFFSFSFSVHLVDQPTFWRHILFVFVL